MHVAHHRVLFNTLVNKMAKAEWKKLHEATTDLLAEFIDESTHPVRREVVYGDLKQFIRQFEDVLMRMYDTHLPQVHQYEQEYQHKECILNSLEFGMSSDVLMTYHTSYSIQPFLY